MGFQCFAMACWPRAWLVEILKDNGRPEAGTVYDALDMDWAKLVGQISQAYKG